MGVSGHSCNKGEARAATGSPKMASGMSDEDLQQIVDGYKGRVRLDVPLDDGSHSSTKKLENR